MKKPVSWTWILLFTTSGTLVCCVIPILLVSLGFGAVVATMASSASWLVALSQNKGLMFISSGTLIALAAFAVYRSGRSCPIEPELALACERADKWNRRFINVSAAMWGIGFLAAYALPLVYQI